MDYRSRSARCFGLAVLLVLWSLNRAPAASQATEFPVDMARGIAQVMQRDTGIRIGPREEIRKALEDGEIDAIAGMGYSRGRDTKFDCTPQYIFQHHAISRKQAAPLIKISGYVPRLAYLVMAGGAVLLVLALFAWWAARLRKQLLSRTRELQERTKELRCIFDVAESALGAESVPELLQGVVGVIPSGWQYPELVRARVVFDGREYSSAPGSSTEWGRTCELSVNGQSRGSLEICYLESPASADVFLATECDLMNAICQLLGQAIHAQLIEDQFLDKRTKYRALFQEMQSGFAVNEILRDAEGQPVDFRFLDVNPAFVSLTGLEADQVVGKTLLEVFSGTQREWAKSFAAVARTGAPFSFESHAAELDRYFEVAAFSAGPGQIAWLFSDVSERRKYEQSLSNNRIRLQSLASRLANAEELLRQDIAAGLHDTIGQDLAALKLSVDIMRLPGRSRERQTDSGAAAALDQVSATIDEIVKKIWTLAFQLCPPGLYGAGLLPTLEWLIDQFNSQHEIDFRLVVEGQLAELDKVARSILFQMVRELLVNAIKHGQPANVRLELAVRDGNFLATVTDDGRGFDVQSAMTTTESSAGFGLFSIRERLTFLSGRLEIESAPGQGTRITVVFPLRNDFDLD